MVNAALVAESLAGAISPLNNSHVNVDDEVNIDLVVQTPYEKGGDGTNACTAR